MQPVFEAIAERSNRLFRRLSTTVQSLVDDTLHIMAFTRTSPEADAALQASFPRPLSRSPWGERIRRGEIVHISDVEVEWPNFPRCWKWPGCVGFRSMLFVPLLREGTDRRHQRHAGGSPAVSPTITSSCCRPLPIRP